MLSGSMLPAFMASPRQPAWPHVQTTSVFPAMDSQWALQNFWPSGGMQLQEEFAHFLVLAIVDPFLGRFASVLRSCVQAQGE